MAESALESPQITILKDAIVRRDRNSPQNGIAMPSHEVALKAVHHAQQRGGCQRTTHIRVRAFSFSPTFPLASDSPADAIYSSEEAH